MAQNRRESQFPLQKSMLVDGQLLFVLISSSDGPQRRLCQVEESPEGTFTIKAVPIVDSCKPGDIYHT
jgi:hypothetical protein